MNARRVSRVPVPLPVPRRLPLTTRRTSMRTLWFVLLTVVRIYATCARLRNLSPIIVRLATTMNARPVSRVPVRLLGPRRLPRSIIRHSIMRTVWWKLLIRVLRDCVTYVVNRRPPLSCARLATMTSARRASPARRPVVLKFLNQSLS